MTKKKTCRYAYTPVKRKLHSAKAPMLPRHTRRIGALRAIFYFRRVSAPDVARFAVYRPKAAVQVGYGYAKAKPAGQGRNRFRIKRIYVYTSVRLYSSRAHAP